MKSQKATLYHFAGGCAKSCLVKFFLLVLCLLVISGVAGAAPLESLEGQSQRGLRLILNRDYDQARRLFDRLSKEFPEQLMGPLGHMAIDQALMYENFDWSQQQHFENLADKSHALQRKILNDRHSSPKELFASSLAFALESYHEARKDNYLKSLQLADKAGAAIERIKGQDRHFRQIPDVLLGYGLYDYWKSTAILKFRFIPMFWLYHDRREQGLARIIETTKKGKYLADVAQLAEAMLFLEQGKNEEGILLARHFLKNYPKNIIMKNFLGMFFLKANRDEDSLKVWKTVRREAPEIRLPYYYSSIIAMRRGQGTAALRELDKFRELGPNNTWQAYALYNEGMIYQAMGRKDLARSRFAEAQNRVKHLKETLAVFQPQ